MKKLIFQNGGRPVVNDDLETLQAQSQLAARALLYGQAACVLSGCQASKVGATWTITGGYVFLAQEVHWFAGAVGVTLPAMLELRPGPTLDERVYETGETKSCMEEALVSVQPYDSDVEGTIRIFDNGGMLRWSHIQQNLGRTAGEVQAVATYNPDHYTATGYGRPGTPAWGWHVANGQDGTADLRGRFVLGHSPFLGSILTPNMMGATGGEEKHTLTEGELPNLTLRLYGSNNSEGDSGFPDLGDDGNTEAAVASGSFKDNAIKSLNTNGEAHNNMPPYYVLLYRQWVGI